MLVASQGRDNQPGAFTQSTPSNVQGLTHRRERVQMEEVSAIFAGQSTNNQFELGGPAPSKSRPQPQPANLEPTGIRSAFVQMEKVEKVKGGSKIRFQEIN